MNNRLFIKKPTLYAQLFSFDGKITARDGMIISRKRSDFGIGTNSVTSVAKKHGGGASFDADGLVFKSSVYVRI